MNNSGTLIRYQMRTFGRGEKHLKGTLQRDLFHPIYPKRRLHELLIIIIMRNRTGFLLCAGSKWAKCDGQIKKKRSQLERRRYIYKKDEEWKKSKKTNDKRI